MHVYDSYWDMLPIEVQDYIRQFKISQQNIDEDRKDLKNRLCKEIHLYSELKSAWNIGHVKCKKEKWYSEIALYGYYRDLYNGKKKLMYLGHGYEEARQRVNHVKSFL